MDTIAKQDFVDWLDPVVFDCPPNCLLVISALLASL